MNRHRRIWFFQQVLIWIFLLGLLFIFGGRQWAFAQEDNGIQLSARAGFDGYCKNDAWIPVQITVTNSGPDLNARVQISYRNSNGSISFNSADIALPTTSQKEFFLYLYPSYSLRNLNVDLLVDDKSLAKINPKISCLPPENVLVGLLAYDPSPYDILNEIQTLNGLVRLAQIQPTDLPDQPQGWDGLDALVIAGQDTGIFTAAQHQALRSWLANGGKLLITGGLNWQNATAGLEDILPVVPVGTRNVDNLNALQAYSKVPVPAGTHTVLTVGNLHPDAEVLIDEGGDPLLAQRQIGLGHVFYLAADPSLQPLADWDGMQDLYSHLFAFKVPRPVWSNGNWNNSAANQALSTLSELGIPSIYYICGWLVVYIIMIGPVNYFVLRRKKRSELAWFTIPGVVIVFTCIAYFFGYFYRGTKPTLNRIVVAQAWEGSDQARVLGLVGLYSPSRTQYVMEAGDQFTFLPFINDNSPQKNGDWQTIQQGTTTLLPDVQVEIGGMKVVSVAGNVPALTFDHDLVLNVSSKTPTVSGTITNTSGITLKDAILVTPGDLKKLGDLPPFSQQEVNVSLVAGKDGPQIYSQDAWILLGLNSYDLDIEKNALRQSALLRAVLNSNTDAKTMWGIYLMGWVDEPLLPVSLQGRQFKTIDTTFYIMMLSPSLHLEPGTVQLPPNMFTWETSAKEISPYYAESSYLPAGGYSIRFLPAVPIQFREVKMLTLHMESSVAPNDVQAYLWDYEKERWVQLENLSWGDRSIPEPWLYVGSGGEIRLKIDGKQDSWMRMGPSNFTLVVEQ